MDRLFDKNRILTIEDLQEGGIFLVDKPLTWTSFDVINKLRYAIRNKLGLKKYKIGHAGTLDPLATGLLVVCFGKKYTKKIESLVVQNKVYAGTIRMAATTPSYDAELGIDTYFPNVPIDIETLKAKAKEFEGDIDQFPPMFSAIKKNGIPLYKLARQGQTIDIPSRPIHIHYFTIENVKWPHVDFEAKCSKGTYIRSLAHDFGKSFDSGAYLSALRRTEVGDFSVEHAWEVLPLFDYISSLEEV